MNRSERLHAAEQLVTQLTSRLENCERDVAGRVSLLYLALRSREEIQLALSEAQAKLRKLHSDKVVKR